MSWEEEKRKGIGKRGGSKGEKAKQMGVEDEWRDEVR